MQVSNAQLAALWRQGLDDSLPSAPFLHIPVCQCTAEVGVSTARHKPGDSSPVCQQSVSIQCSDCLSDAAAGHCALCSPDLVPRSGVHVLYLPIAVIRMCYIYLLR